MIDYVEFLDLTMRYLVVPIVAFVWLLNKRQQDHETKISVMESEVSMARTAHDREIRDLKIEMRSVREKLDELTAIILQLDKKVDRA